MKISKFLILISSLVFCSSAWALSFSSDKEWFKPFQWEAFVSQSAIYSSDYNYLSRSDDTLSLDMWEAGLLFSTKVKGDLSFSAQVLGRKVSEYSDEDLRIDYGFFSLPWLQSQSGTLGLRLGRIRSSYGLYNETRDIPHTRTGIVMPQVLYYDMTRNSFYSADGIELFAQQDLGDKRIEIQVLLSKPITDQDESVGNYQFIDVNKISGDKGFLTKISYGSEFDGWRAALTYYRPNYKAEVMIKPVAGFIPTALEEPNASFYSENILSSLEYNRLNWTLTAEYLRHKFHTNIPTFNNFSAMGVEAEYDSYEEAFYIQGLYRFDDQWQGFVRVEQSKIRNISSDRTRFESSSLGVTYRPDQKWLVRAEAHYVEGFARLFARDNDLSQASHPYWNALLFQVAYKW